MGSKHEIKKEKKQQASTSSAVNVNNNQAKKKVGAKKIQKSASTQTMEKASLGLKSRKKTYDQGYQLDQLKSTFPHVDFDDYAAVEITEDWDAEHREVDEEVNDDDQMEYDDNENEEEDNDNTDQEENNDFDYDDMDDEEEEKDDSKLDLPIKRKLRKAGGENKKSVKYKGVASSFTLNEPMIPNKIDLIDMSRKKQVATFSDEWEIAETISQGGYQLDQWIKDICAKDAYFLGKDRYIYPNVSTLKKFVECIRTKQVPLQAISLPFLPMNKVISNNPKIVVGISGVRHIQRGGGLSVWPVFYIEKEQYNDNNKKFSTKTWRVNLPLHKLDVMADALTELSRGLGFDMDTS